MYILLITKTSFADIKGGFNGIERLFMVVGGASKGVSGGRFSYPMADNFVIF